MNHNIRMIEIEIDLIRENNRALLKIGAIVILVNTIIAAIRIFL